jgi:hypothetical protein
MITVAIQLMRLAERYSTDAKSLQSSDSCLPMNWPWGTPNSTTWVAIVQCLYG